MGCQWSGEKPDFDHLHGNVTIDEEEKRLHMKAWRDGATRQRVLSAGPSGEAHDVMAIQESLAYHIHLLKVAEVGGGGGAEGTLSAAIERTRQVNDAAQQKQKQQQQLASENAWASPPSSPPVSSGAGLIIHQHPAVSSTQDARKSRLAQLEAEQEKAKEERLMQLDAGCWQDMAEHGLFQKAEDLLTSAADLEEKKVGQTERYATLMHALGALYDFRSNVDVTGQQQMLSLKSAKFAERAVKVLHALVAKAINDQIMGVTDGATAQDGNRLSDQLAKSLLMRGKSLCNTALDGSPSLEMTAESAFDDAERDVKDAAAIREKLRHSQLAEAVMAVGYVYYCRACRVLNSPDADSVVGQIDYMEENYTMALEHYKRSLQMYIERVGNEHADSIRMRCNIALVYNVMSRMPCEKRMEYIEEAEKQYREVLKTQEKVFGKRHQRTQRLEIDLQNIEERKAQIAASQPNELLVQRLSGMTPAEIEKAEAERKAQADKLMDEFLQARRKERAGRG